LANSVPNNIERVLYQILVKFEKPDEESKLTTNARRMERVDTREREALNRVTPKSNASGLESKEGEDEPMGHDYRQDVQKHA